MTGNKENRNSSDEILHVGKKEELSLQIGGAIEFISKPEGWGEQEVSFLPSDGLLLGDPDRESSIMDRPEYIIEGLRASWQRTKEIREPAGDYNSEKVIVSSLDVDKDGGVIIRTGRSDYFTLWGMPGAAPTLHKKAINDLEVRRTTDVPMGISTHNMLLINDGEVKKLVMMVQSRGHAFSAGRISTTFEEQMEVYDENSFNTVVRGFKEELGIDIKDQNIKLLGIAAETGAAYCSFCHITEMSISEDELIRFWEGRGDKCEGVMLFAVPINGLDAWSGGTVPYFKWRDFDTKPDIQKEIDLNLHATALWRIDLLRRYLNTAN